MQLYSKINLILFFGYYPMQIFIIFKLTIETHLTNVVMFIVADCMLHVN